MSTQAKQQATPSISGFEPYKEVAGEEYMGKPMRAHFTKVLNKWKQDLMQEVDRTVAVSYTHLTLPTILLV